MSAAPHGDEALDAEALEGLAIVEAALCPDAPDDPRDLLARGILPREFDGLRLQGLLGRGGMGEVYLARQVGLDREVAVKVAVAPASAALPAADLFAREGRLLAALDHPGIVRVHGVGEVAGRRYLVMERVPGRTLEQADPAALPTAELLHLGAALAEALAAAHARGVVHRDLKPANVVLAGEAGRERPRLLDFGIAGHAFDPPEVAGLGTRRYMAPEQRDGRPVGPAADVFALGVMLREALAGRRDLPPGVDELLHDMALADPAARPADGAAVLARLRPLLPARDAREAWRRRAPWLVAACAPLVMLAALQWREDPATRLPPRPAAGLPPRAGQAVPPAGLGLHGPASRPPPGLRPRPDGRLPPRLKFAPGARARDLPDAAPSGPGAPAPDGG